MSLCITDEEESGEVKEEALIAQVKMLRRILWEDL